jgi:hypothetical protein
MLQNSIKELQDSHKKIEGIFRNVLTPHSGLITVIKRVLNN